MTEPSLEVPRKIFREEAKSGSINCLSCGAPIQLHGFGGTRQVNCPYCGSTLAPDDSGELELAQRAERAQRTSVLPMYARGMFDDIQWEIIGVVWREAVVEGTAYPWQELLLFNPYRGYRWLIFSMTDGSWMLGETLDGAPMYRSSAHRSVEFDGKVYRHFQSSSAVVTYVEGEFPWQIQVGDRAAMEDFVAPPLGVSVEFTTTADGQDVSFTGSRHIDPEEVWAAFGQTGSAPGTGGVSMLAPNPHKESTRVLWRLFAVLVLVWFGLSALYSFSRSGKVVLDENGLDATTLVREITIGKSGRATTLELQLELKGLRNGWGHAGVLLVEKATGKATAFGLEVDDWRGADWSEGSNPAKTVIGGIEGGEYTVQLDMQYDKTVVNGPAMTQVRIRQDVVLLRYIVFPFVFILFFPLFNFIRSGAFEARRWSNSDYSNSD